MRKILFTVLTCCAAAFVGCSKNNDDVKVADKENCVAKPIALLLQGGDLTSIMQESDGSVKYQVQMFSADDKGNKIICNNYVSNLRNQWAGSKESNDKLEYLNGYTVIICQCSDRIETANKIYERFNNGATPIQTNLK